MPDDHELNDALERLGEIRLDGFGHVRQKQEVMALLFGDRAPQRRVDRFVILDELGRGGMGIVLRAHDEKLDREVAIKLMKNSSRSAHGQRLLREAQALAKLAHPNVIQVYEVGTSNDHMFIAMQLVRGRTLEDWQRERRPWSDCVDVYMQAGRGLAAAHAAGLIHRDFKPSNCMLDERGVVRVLDFGLAREEDASFDEPTGPVSVLESGAARAGTAECGAQTSSSSGASISMLRQRLTQTGSVMGTRAYMAPEQMARMYVDARSDQFSFCVALYEALYGRRPFPDDSFSLFLDMAEGAPHPPRPPAPGVEVPRWLQRIVRRGLSARPDARWPSMDVLLDELERRRHPPRRRWVSWMSAAMGATVALGGAQWLAGAGSEPSCQDTQRRLDGIWDERQQDTVRDAILTTGLPYADRTWSNVKEQFDLHVQQLGGAYLEACEAEELGRREGCLDDLLDDLRGRVALLGHLDDRHRIDHAVEFLSRAASVDRCRDAPGGSEFDRDALALRREFGELRRLEQFGRHQEGIEQLGPVLERAEQLGDRRLLAQALQLAGQLHLRAGDDDLAEAFLRRAHRDAVASADDDTAVGAMASLVHLVGVEHARTEAALLFGSTAEALATRPGVDPSAHAELLTAIAQIHTARGDYPEARRSYARAIGILEGVRGPSHIAVVEALDGLGTAADKQGRLEEAEASYRRALGIREAWQGDEHPDTAYQRVNLGVVLARRGRNAEATGQRRHAVEFYRQAVALDQRALRVFTEADQIDHKRIAHARSNLGTAFSLLGQYADAEQQLREAIGYWDDVHGADHPRVAMARFNLGTVLARQSRATEAAQQYDQVLGILMRGEITPEAAQLIAKTLSKLERISIEQGQVAEIQARYRRALGLIEARQGHRHPLVVSLRDRLEELLLLRDDRVDEGP